MYFRAFTLYSTYDLKLNVTITDFFFKHLIPIYLSHMYISSIVSQVYFLYFFKVLINFHMKFFILLKEIKLIQLVYQELILRLQNLFQTIKLSVWHWINQHLVHAHYNFVALHTTYMYIVHVQSDKIFCLSLTLYR